jgi:hypothetical protein
MGRFILTLSLAVGLLAGLLPRADVAYAAPADQRALGQVPATPAQDESFESATAAPFNPFTLVTQVAGAADGAHSVQTADFDRDGRRDVVAASREDGRIVWHRNLGGTPAQFAAQQIALAPGVYAVATGDLDRDGRMDIVGAAVGTLDPSAADGESAAAGGGSVFWLQNNLPASPSFVRRDIAVGLNYPVSVHVADLESDGDADVLVATRDDSRITWYENSGAPTISFTPRVVTAQAQGAVSVHAADLDGDGKLDVLSASENDNRILWFRNNGARPPAFELRVVRGGPAPPGILDFAKSVFGADIDGDGDADIVYASEDQNQVGWYENRNRGASFVEHVLLTNAQHAKFAMAADLDQDGALDIVAVAAGEPTNGTGSFVAVLWNNGAAAPQFSSQVVATGLRGARHAVVADIDDDGDPELLTASRNDDRVMLFTNTSIHRTALYDSSTQFVVGTYNRARGVFPADLDNDGDLDILAASETQVAWHENDGKSPPGFAARTIATSILGGRWVYAADLDQDGDLDVISASKTDSKINWYENLWSGRGTVPTFVERLVSNQATGARMVNAADLDRDGDLDLYSASDSDDVVAWYENLGGRPAQFMRRLVDTDANYVRSAYAADLDGDGDLDLMSVSAYDHQVAWYENRGGRPLRFVRRIIAQGVMGALHVHADDLDGDGDMDILSASELDSTIAWYENQGRNSATFVKRVITPGAPGVHAVYTGDVDQDGDNDVIAAIEFSNTVAWYENNGGAVPGFTEHVIVNSTMAAHGIYAADLDGDGDLDVLSASRDDGKISWFENRGGQYGVASRVQGAADGSLVADIAFTHRGRGGDPALRVSAVILRLTDSAGRALDTGTTAAYFDRLLLYRDRCCNGVFEPGQDTLLATLAPIPIVNGTVTVPLAESDAGALLATGGSAHYFAVMENAATGCNAYGRISVSHAVDGSTARDSQTGAPLLAERMRNLKSGTTPEMSAKPALVINEIMPNNEAAVEDPDEPEEYPDWFELYNPSPMPVNLSGLFLTDDVGKPMQYEIPNGVLIPAQGYLVFYADGEPEQGPLHTNFKLSSDGETIVLVDSAARNYQVLDSVSFDAQAPDISVGRLPNGGTTWSRLNTYSPGQYNLNFRPSHFLQLPYIGNGSICP